ncbi:ATP-binding protein [Symbioplanes lichenis]|uniref:ATP-binding protein n=1 Tax=Symbioplanes lichenis TaxID=1629072 RepID=UPI002739BB54|nr:ATP-binding protein [Actinoplanes lichenis]
MSAPATDDLRVDGPGHFRLRLSLVELRVRQAAAARRSVDPDPDDPLRGLHLSAEHVQRLLDDPAAGALPDLRDAASFTAVEEAADRAVEPLPLRVLAQSFGLTALDIDLLLVALLPDLDRRYEKLYGYLNDDVTRPRATVGLALELCGLPPVLGAARARLTAGCPLVDGGLVLPEDGDRPFLTRTLRVPDRLIGHLLGDPRPDARLTGLVRAVPDPGWQPRGTAGLAAALRAGHQLFYLHDPGAGSPDELATAALLATGRPALRLDLDALATDPAPAEVVPAAVREARLTGAGLIAGPVDPARLGSLRGLLDAPVPVVLSGRSRWDPFWAPTAPVLVTAPEMGVEQRARSWRAALSAYGTPAAATVDVERELAPYTLTAPQVRRAAVVAAQQALVAGSGVVDAGALRTGVRTQNAAGLEQLARRVEPAVTWDDLVLPDDAATQLRDLAARVRHRERVLGQWRLRPGGGRGRGVTALFAGDSGTGKTMSAEVIAADLGLDLYVVDLSTVVDKYVGQTEKNLERIFTEAAGVNGVLLFDEADAIFGKRSEVSDANDRYANMESAYLLQRMESFDGVAVLTTNLRANLDEAFIRRLDVIVDFPVPDRAQRRALWDHCLGRDLPRAGDLDLDRCARVYELSGGAIRACAVTAGYLAAADDGPVTMAHLIAAAQREYRKLGRLLPAD